MWQTADGEPSTLVILLIFGSMPFIIIIGDNISRAIGRKWKQRR